MENDIIYFEVNNWCPVEDYPDTEPFETWLDYDYLNETLLSDKWARENKVCIVFTIVDMSLNFNITATRKWVEENCPVILQEPWKSKFCHEPDEDNEDVQGRFAWFLPYEESNFGVVHREWE